MARTPKKPPKAVELENLEVLHKVFARHLITDWSLAVDGGANKGLWTELMAGRFGVVHSFEPNPESFTILEENTKHLPNVVRHEVALMHEFMRVTMEPTGKRNRLTSCRAYPDENGEAIAVPLDSLNFPSCGLLKLDLEGTELEALGGAQDLIRRCRPVLIVEENKPWEDLQAITFMRAKVQYEVVMHHGVDLVMVPKC